MSLSLVLPLELVRWPTEAFSGSRSAPRVLCTVGIFVHTGAVCILVQRTQIYVTFNGLKRVHGLGTCSLNSFQAVLCCEYVLLPTPQFWVPFEGCDCQHSASPFGLGLGFPGSLKAVITHLSAFLLPKFFCCLSYFLYLCEFVSFKIFL